MGKKISNIVFTKNRPLQLEGYLESLYKHLSCELIQTYILYKPELFDTEYQQVFEKYSDCIVIREMNFSADFFSILNRINTKYILFGVDDIVYFDSVNFDVIEETFQKHAADIFGFSLRLSSQNIGKNNEPISEVSVAGQTLYRINWPQGRTPNTRYPFELCATIYRTELIGEVLRGSRNGNRLLERIFAPDSLVTGVVGRLFSRHSVLKRFGYFYNPNSLESWNCRWCQNNSDKLPSQLYFQKICAAAIQVNMVNTSTSNESDSCAEYTVETLAERYRQGYRLDIDAIVNNKPTQTHCGKEYFTLTKG